MARKKGSGKGKSAGRKTNPDIKQTEKKTDAKVKDDPGGGGARGGKAAMEIPNHRSESKLRQQSNGGDGEPAKLTSAETGRRGGGGGVTGSERAESNAATRNTSPATSNNNNNSSSMSRLPAPATTTTTVASSGGGAPSDLKYLHKKFKRIASATVTEEDDQKQRQTVQEREPESAKLAVREPATGNSFLASSTPQQQQQLLVPLVRPSATVAPLISHPTPPPSSSVSRPLVPSASPHQQHASGDRSVACGDPPGDESTKIVAVRTPSGGGGGGGGSGGAGGFNSASGGGVPTDNTLSTARADREASAAVAASSAALIGSNAGFDYRQQQQQQQQQQQLQHQYHQLHPSLHPGVATVAAFQPQPLLPQHHHHHHHHPQPHHLLYHHHQQQPHQGLPPQQQTSANSASGSSNNSSSSSSTSISGSISNSNNSSSSGGGGGNVLLLPQSAIEGAAAVTSSSSSSLSSLSLSSAPAAISDNCDLSVANKLAKSPYSPLGGGAVQYIVAYPQQQQQQQQRAVDGTLLLPITSEKLKYHSALHYANGAQPPSHRGLSSSSGGSSGSPSPPSSVISNLGATSGHHFAAVSSSSATTSGAAVGGGSAPANTAVVAPGPPGRYVCPYCQMNCSKPSVLEKHIRRHTNERPFKCDLCGIAFKTKSNLYKHRRSRAHASKSQCEDPNGDEDGGSLGGSDIDDKELSNSGSEIMNYRSSPMDERVHSPQQLLVEKPYKPKFHNAALYAKVESKPVATVGPVGGGSQQLLNAAAVTASVNPSVSHYLNGQNVESLEQHISKLISQNEAIVEVVEAPLQKKYHKITGISRGISVSGTSSSHSPFTQSSPAAVPNHHTTSGVSSIPTQNSQPLASTQDTAESRLAIALQQKRHAEEQQIKHQIQMQQMLQVQHQQLPHQPSYVATYSHLPGQQSVINLTNRPVVTPKSALGLQQQPQPQPLASVVVVNGILPTGTPTPPSSGSMESASGNTVVARGNQHNNDGGNSYQPLNLTKVIVQEQIPTSNTSITVPSSSMQSTAPHTLPPESEDGQAAIQQHPLPPYRKRTREQSLEMQLLNVPISTTAAEVVAASVSIATATTTTCSTTTLPVSTTVSSGASTTVSASQPPHVPLHIQVSSGSGHRPTPTPTPPLTITNHPQNPERSIIKDLLLNSRAFGVVQNPDGENGESLYTCKMCNVSFRDVDSLKYHMICYCQGNGSPSSSSAPISPVGSPSAAAASYIRSRSVSSLKQLARSSLNPPPARTPASLTRLAKSQLTRPRTKPENISLPADSSSPSSSSTLSLGASSSSGSSRGTVVDMVQNPLPSPGPLLGNTRLVDSHRTDSGKPQQKAIGTDNEVSLTKRARVGVMESSEHASTSNQKPHHPASSVGHNALQLFGGEVEVVARKATYEDEAAKLSSNVASSTLPVHRYTGPGATYTQTLGGGMEIEDEEAHQRALHYRQTLHSGSTLMELARTETSTGQSVPPKVTATTPTHFQFPPINSITAFNPLTLPAVPAPPPGQASQIVHGGKLIPFVQGMPGPNTLSSVGHTVELLHSSMEKRPDPNSQSLLTIVVPSGAGNAPSLPTAHPLASSLLAIQQPGVVASSSSSSSRVHLEAPLKKQSLGVPKNGLSTREIWSPAKQQQQQQQQVLQHQQADFSSPSPTQAVPRKSFNFTRMADNVSPRKKSDIPLFLGGAESKSKPEEIRYFNFETMISSSEIMIKPPPPPPPPSATVALMVDTSSSVATSQESTNAAVPASPRPNKFLRPNSLPLKPGTFTPKRHHGITPTNNTMPLISPETPRPSKSCRELYFNGHAYTNIGLKSSTKPFYCTVNKTQPFYFQTQKQLSMYSNWQVHPENDPHPLGLRQVTVMALYDSNHHRDRKYSIAGPRKVPLAIVGSRPAGGNIVSCVSSEGQVRVSPMEVKSNVPCPPAYVLATLAAQQPSMATLHPPTRYSRESPSPGLQYSEKSKSSIDQTVPSADSALMMVTTSGGGSRHASRSASAERALSGGFESTEEYTYVRGRGRGKYVCNECGIRCKKPSMLKKHIRTHTDVRPYSCQYCSFHFKTKGNLTKHMKSKSHFKKCTELGLNPVPVHVDDDGGDIDIEGDQQSVSSERTSTIPGDSDTATDTDGDETDDSDEMKSRLTEHEAAEGLLSLSMTRPTSACSSLGTGQQHSAGGGNSEPTAAAAAAYISQHISSYLTPEQQQSHGLLYPTTSPNPSHSPMMMNVQQQQQVDSAGHAKLDSGGGASLPRRIITYGNGPKLEFNLLKHEQYYSDPNLGSKKKREHERNAFPTASDEAARAGDADDEDDTARPIDLTKKPRHQQAAKASTGSASSQPSSYHQYDDRPRSDHQTSQSQTQPLAMVTPPNSQQLSVGGQHHPMIRPLDREQLALHQQMYENRLREPVTQQLEQQQPQPQVIVRVSDVLTPISGAANLLTTLVSNTDKIPMIVAPFEPSVGTTPGGVDENSYFHEYLKERALQDTRIKQSQMKPGSSIVMREQQHSQPPAAPPQLHGQLAQEQIRYNVQQHQILLQPRYEDAHAPASANNPGLVAQAPLATKATPPPAALPPVAAATGTTITPSAAAATIPPPSTERVYRIFSGKNERHRVSPTTEPAARSIPASQTNEINVCSSVVTNSTSSTAASLRMLSNECPLVSENASPMDTLAEIAAGSVKLDVSKVQQLVPEPSTIAALTVMPTPATVTPNARSRCNSFSSNAKVAPQHPVPESAKNLASEYLKLAQSVTSGGAMRKRADSESASGGGISDHEMSPITLVNPPPPIAPAVPVLPATMQQQQQQQPPPTGASVTGSGTGSTVVGSSVPGVEVAAGGGSVMGPARKVVVVGEDGFKKTVGGGRPVASAGGEFVGTPPNAFTPSMHQEDGGRPVCEICNKKFHKLSQLSIHMNIHYMERKYRCEPCGTSFRSQGLYLKHERSATHRNKVSMTTTFGVATDTNPRPFYCRDCEVGFRIHGHLAKHLRSKMHVLKLECLGKLPFGTYTEIERSGTNLTEIDTSDCENSLSSLKRLAVRLNVKDPAKVLPAGGGSSASSSSSSSGAGGIMGGGGGTSGNETDSCDDNFGMENGEDESSPSGGSKDDTTPGGAQGTPMTNGGGKDGALEAAASTPCNGGGEMRNINNNVKRKMDDFSSPAMVAEDVATCSTATANIVSEAKRPRYSLELLDARAGNSGGPQEEREGGVATSTS
ncbi:uncharacterized protein LOC131294820 [Anopheles ziemanni]|uniref:uncharacterized protein LOC131265384 n=1 Tax=Anopheles coustani TaxID=139045 RepID=UPI002658C7B1|nr:uncharacterized protein LOC131265384 [Anopheles coustani]XP_058178849.1 uncharacterized protein LOC131294820 [Anopheles ziemanni]